MDWKTPGEDMPPLTKEVDGIVVPQMTIRELISHLEMALSTMEHNRNASPSKEEAEACQLMLAIFGNSLDYMRLFQESLKRFEKAQEDAFQAHLDTLEPVGGIC